MNARLDPLRQVARDLVEKRLWPVAALLVAAIVAVPLLLGSSSSEPQVAAPTSSAAAPASPTKAFVTVAEQPVTGKNDRPGKLRNPIYDPPQPPAPETATAGPASSAAATAAPRKSTAAPATGGGASATPPATSPKPATPPATPPAKPSVADRGVYQRTEVRWYSTKVAKKRPLSRLTPLGGNDAPAVLYLGVTRSDASYAVFLLGPGATSRGDATCEKAFGCRLIGLKAGEKQTVTHAGRTYTLEAHTVKTVRTSAEKAAQQRARVHPEGREAMRGMWQDAATAKALGQLRYSERLGLLYRIAEKAAE